MTDSAVHQVELLSVAIADLVYCGFSSQHGSWTVYSTDSPVMNFEGPACLFQEWNVQQGKQAEQHQYILNAWVAA